MKGRDIPYSADELAFIEWRQAMSRRALHEAFVARFGRTDVSLANFKALCKRMGWKTGRTGCFVKGREPANKGKPMRAATKAKLARTWFKKGHLPHNANYLGHERISKDGYTEISVDETNPHTGYERRYRLKHVWLWEQANGPVPEGHCLKCLDGDRLNTDPANWEAIPRALLPRLSGGRWHKPYDAYEPEVRPSVLAIAKLEHAARKAAE
jgi:hypothetical protein